MPRLRVTSRLQVSSDYNQSNSHRRDLYRIPRALPLNSAFPLPPQCLALAASHPGSVLLETARVDEENYRSYLFLHPRKILEASDTLFDQIEQALARGEWVAGFFSYEFGRFLQGMQLAENAGTNTPKLWLGVYEKPFVFNHRTGAFEGNSPIDPDAINPEASFEIRNLKLSISKLDYDEKIAAIHEYIRSGDTYQVNFTTDFQFDFRGSQKALFSSLKQGQHVSYSAFLRNREWDILSLSPELFFRRNGNHIVTRPMKGTAPRGVDFAEDQFIARQLENNPKDRSENVMIVDLLRNDLGRICEYGSVAVNHLFSIETYQTLFQMTSEISGTLRPEASYSDIFQSLFPCGSITGAPKLRTMEIIGELEDRPRGVYTGAIGFFSPHSEAVFSVPIRTLVLQKCWGTMGVGGGIVIDSRAQDEYQECLLKSRFLTERVAASRLEDPDEPFELLESILWHDGYQRLAMHLDRIENSARYFDFNFDRQAVAAALQEAATHFLQSQRLKVRMTLDRSGTIKITHAPAAIIAQGDVAISSKRVFSGDRFVRHKTTRRSLYDQQYQWALEQGLNEILFLNERDEVTEGAISNVFLEKDGEWLTPPIRSGVLPGVFRRHLLETNPRAKERVLQPSDIASANAIYLCNSVRGLTKVNLVLNHDDFKTRKHF